MADDQITDIAMAFFGKMNFKMGFFLFFIFMLLTSNFFVIKYLARYTDAVTSIGDVTLKGNIIRGVILVLVYMSLEIISTLEYL